MLLFLGACEAEPVRDVEDDVRPRAARPETPDRSGQQKIIAFGDSLTAGLGIGRDEAYPALLQELIDAEGYPYEVINAGVSGETSAGGVRRLEWVLEDRDAAMLILELGANDGLRGLPPDEMKKNLATIIDLAAEREIPVLLAGLSVGDEHSNQYVQRFVGVYQELADEHEVAFMPHFLEGVAGVEALNQPDGKHPNAAGARVVAENVWKYLKPALSPADP